MASRLLSIGAMRSLLIGAGVVVLLAAPAMRAESVAEHCPGYAAQLRRARDLLVHGERAGAIAALRGAQDAIGECLRRDSDEDGEPIMLAASSTERLVDQNGRSACCNTRSTSAGSTRRPASS
jgi:hypothetical protein